MSSVAHAEVRTLSINPNHVSFWLTGGFWGSPEFMISFYDDKGKETQRLSLDTRGFFHGTYYYRHLISHCDEIKYDAGVVGKQVSIDLSKFKDAENVCAVSGDSIR